MHSLTTGRKKTIGLIICGLAGLALSAADGDALQRGKSMKVDAAVAAPELIAVRVHHDMCPYCKKLALQFDKLGQQAKDEPVLLVTLDLTSEATQRQAAMMVASLGIESVWTGDLSAIGTVYFVDGKSKSVIAKYAAYDASEPMTKVLRRALASTRP